MTSSSQAQTTQIPSASRSLISHLQPGQKIVPASSALPAQSLVSAYSCRSNRRQIGSKSLQIRDWKPSIALGGLRKPQGLCDLRLWHLVEQFVLELNYPPFELFRLGDLARKNCPTKRLNVVAFGAKSSFESLSEMETGRSVSQFRGFQIPITRLCLVPEIAFERRIQIAEVVLRRGHPLSSCLAHP